MTPAREAEIRRRLKSIEESGKWIASDNKEFGLGFWSVSTAKQHNLVAQPRMRMSTDIWSGDCGDNIHSDRAVAEFIADAPLAIEELLAEVERLKALPAHRHGPGEVDRRADAAEEPSGEQAEK
jgi:hypothetical protein